MKLNVSRLLLKTQLSLIVCVALLDIFIPESHPSRNVVVYLQAIVLGIFLVYILFSYMVSGVILSVFHHSLLIFMALLVICGLISEMPNRLPPMLYSTAPFFLFYYGSWKGYLTSNILLRIAVLLLCVFALESIIGVVTRAGRYSTWYIKADNVGNSLMFLILFFSLDLKKSQNIILMLVTYALVLISFKRGAMIAATTALIIIIWQLIFNTDRVLQKSRKKLVYLTLSAVIFLLFIMIMYWDVLMFRFTGDTGGGSGRLSMWQMIVDNWKEGGLIRQIFGFGFFKVQDLMTEIRGVPYFAHSDWIQLLYDHGMLGVLIYFLLIIFYIAERKTVLLFAPEMFSSYIASISIWILKSAWSGVYLTKHSVLLFLIAGFILGFAYRKKYLCYEFTKQTL